MVESTCLRTKTCELAHRKSSPGTNTLLTYALIDEVDHVTAQYHVQPLHFVWLDRVVVSNVQKDQGHIPYSTVML